MDPLGLGSGIMKAVSKDAELPDEPLSSKSDTPGRAMIESHSHSEERHLTSTKSNSDTHKIPKIGS